MLLRVTLAAMSAWAICVLRTSCELTSAIPTEPPMLRDRLSKLAALVRSGGASVAKARLCIVTNKRPSPRPWISPLQITGLAG